MNVNIIDEHEHEERKKERKMKKAIENRNKMPEDEKMNITKSLN